METGQRRGRDEPEGAGEAEAWLGRKWKGQAKQRRGREESGRGRRSRGVVAKAEGGIQKQTRRLLG